MNEFSERAKRTSRLKRNSLIAVVVAICAIVAYVLWSRADALTHRLESSTPTPSSAQIATASALAALDRAKAAQIPRSQTTRGSDPGWEALLKKVTALLGGKKIEVCGLPDLDAALFLAEQEDLDGFTLNHSRIGQSEANAALAQASAKLIQSESLPEQALGWYVQARQTGTVADPLVKLALAGRDPAIFATALHACAGKGGNPCASISATDWTTLEPDNAAVWLMVAGEANARKDTVVRDAALRRAAATTGYNSRFPALAPVFDTAPVTAQSALVQSLVGGTLISMDAIHSSVQKYSALMQYCVRDKTVDPTRNSTCDTLANKLLDHDDYFVGDSIAAYIGEKIGWDASRVQFIRDKKDVEMSLAYDDGSISNVYGCESLAKSNQWLRDSFSKGDRARARERIAKSGKTLATHIEEYRKAHQATAK